MRTLNQIVVSVVALAGATASAQPETQLRYEVRKFDPGHNNGWGGSVDAFSGDRIEVRALVSYIGTAPVIALGQVIFQPTVSHWLAGDTLLTIALLGESGPTIFADGIGPSGSYLSTPPALTPDAPGVYGRIAPFTASFVAGGSPITMTFYRGHVHANPDGSGLTYLRIARADVTNWFGVGATSGPAAANNVSGVGGITAFQGSLGTNRPSAAPPPVLSTQNILVFKFGFTLSGDTAARDLTITTPNNGFGTYTNSPGYGGPGIGWFMSSTENGIGSRRTTGTAVPAIVRVVPTPASAVLLGFGAILAARRRR